MLVAQAAQDHGKRRKSEVGLRLATAGGEEKQVHRFPIR